MKILVTGGAGFIGSHVVDALIAARHRVAVIDDLSTGFKKNLRHKTRLYRTDIRNFKKISEIMERENPDAVVHHAAVVDVASSVKNAGRTEEINVIGTVNLLKAFGALPKRAGRKFIFASSAAVYGNTARLPIRENAPLRPISPYGTSKLVGEELIRSLAPHYGFSYTILRYANVYGPRQNPFGEGGVVAIFSRKMAKGERPVIFGNGLKTRDYVFVEDVARANLLALTKGKDGTFNIATAKETKDKEVFDAIASALGYRGAPGFAPVRKGEIMRSALSPHGAAKGLGWRPKTAFRAGIKKTAPRFGGR